jgi:DNA-binding IclR family transcriptional regulator
VKRACELLKHVARGGSAGSRITDLCEAAALNRPTAHRILASLVKAGLLQQHPGSPRYFLGSGLYELGMAAPSPIARFSQVRSMIEQLAATTGDTVYLMLRSHGEFICAWRAEGAYPIKANVTAIGDRRPIASGVAGLSILAGLPPADASLLIEQNEAELARFCRMSAADALRHVQAGRNKGYVLSYGAVMEGVAAVGMCVPSAYGHPYLGLSVSAISPRIPPERIEALVELLGKATREMSLLIDGS